MPTYEYKCTACGHRFEKFQSMSSDPIRKCPECGKMKVQRLIGTGAGLIFKGSGFYITDYRDSSYKDKAKADTAGGGDTKTETKSESKSDAKAESKPETKPAAAEPKPAPAPEPKASKSAKKK